MVSNRFPSTGSGRQKEGGELATRKQDFNAHVQGNGFRHTAPNIDMGPVIPSLGGATVQETLEQIVDLIASSGTGFISIGNAGVDGYAVGSYNMNTLATPTLWDAFRAAFADPRLQNGGVILVLAGTYSLTAPVTVPPGITIMGEIGGTLIIGEMSEQPMFIIENTVKDLHIGGDSGGGQISLDSGSNVEKTKFFNLMLSDNLNGAVASGGASMATVPMISMKKAANLELERVSFLGKINDGVITDRIKTLSALATASGASTGSILTIKDCFFDGLKVGIQFDGVLGDKDYLTVTGCKARTYGTEGAAGIPTNSFIVSSLCNMKITNNHYVGAGTITNTFLNITVTGGTTDTLRVIMTGNTGSPTTLLPSNLIDNDSGVTFSAVVTGNSWGSQADSPWYVVVGGADGDQPLGDIYGPSAIDTIFALFRGGYEGTVIVNPGTYNLVAPSGGTANFANLRIIGNKKGRDYPIFNLNVASSSVDTLNNRYLTFGNHIESIQFTSTTTYQSVRPGFSPTSRTAQNAAHNMVVKDCIFTNVALNVMNIGAGPFTDSSGNSAKLSITIDSCDFRQTGTFSDNYCLVCPPANSVRVINCNFTGYGYAMDLGTDIYVSPATIQDAMYSVENCTFDLTGFTIDDHAPGSAFDRYVTVKDTVGNIVLKNCQIYASNTLAAATPINAALVSPTATFTKFVYVFGKNIYIDGCVINGPQQAYFTGGNFYGMPALFAEPIENFVFTNSRVIGGGVPLQIGGDNAFTSSFIRGGIKITNSEFAPPSASTSITAVLLDIDIDLPTDMISTHIRPTIDINNCLFFQNLATISTPAQHFRNTASYYDADGLIQIYAPYFDIDFSDNKVQGILRQFGTFATPFRHYAGVVVNNWNNTAAAGDASDQIWRTHIHNNNIVVDSFFETNSSSNASAAAVYVKSSYIQIFDNVLQMINHANTGGMTQFTGCLYLDNLETTDIVSSDAMVSGNMISRRDRSGDFTTLVRGFISVTASSGRGMIVNNSYSDTTFDGSSTTLLEDNTSTANKWLHFGNKNQTETIKIRGNSGQLGLGLTSTGIKVAAGTIPGVAASELHFLYASTTAAVSFAYNDTSVNETMLWSIPLYQIVPHGAYITAVSVPVDITVDPSSTSIATLILRDTASSSNDTENPVTTAGATLSLTATQNARPSLPSKQPTVEITMQINSSSTTVFTIGEVSVTYTW